MLEAREYNEVRKDEKSELEKSMVYIARLLESGKLLHQRSTGDAADASGFSVGGVQMKSPKSAS
jgi:hypothetical protein